MQFRDYDVLQKIDGSTGVEFFKYFTSGQVSIEYLAFSKLNLSNISTLCGLDGTWMHFSSIAL